MAKTPASRHVWAFRNGRNQAIRIPREFELPGQAAILRQDEDGRLIIEPLKPRDLLTLLSGWAPLKEADTMPSIEDRPVEPIKL